MSGASYRVKPTHPRREGPLRITRLDGSVIAVSGETCERATAAELASMIANGYVEPIADASGDAPAPRRRKAGD